MDIKYVKYGGGRKSWEDKPYILVAKGKERQYGKILECPVCNIKYFTPNYKAKKGNTVCSPQCAGRKYTGYKSPVWKGGKGTRTNGYVEITIPDTHPLKLKGKRYIAEHRLIVEKNIGRYLKSSEFIHHLNGIKIDNRLENLALCTRQNHFEFIKKLQERILELERKE